MVEGLPSWLAVYQPATSRRRSLLSKLCLAVAVVLSAVVLAGSTIGWAAYQRFDRSLTRLPVTLGGVRPAERPGDMNVLLLGSDSREGTSGEYGSQAEVGGLHSDTVILAHLGGDGTATLLSIPRDTLVTAPRGTPHTPADGRDKLTNVLSNGGVQATIITLETLMDLKIDHFIIIDLVGFKKMTDAVGGVTVCVTPLPDGSTANLNDNWSQWHGHLGQNQLNGDQALAFVRTRHALGDERLRVLRQQQFLAKLLARATSAGVLSNPAKITQLIGAVGGSLTVDAGLSEPDMIKIARRLHGLGGDGMRFITLPTHVPTAAEGAVDIQGDIPPHGDVLIYEARQAEQILAPLRPARADDQSPVAAPVLDPGQVHVAEVRNGTTRQGLATRTIRALRSAGFAGAMFTAPVSSRQAATDIGYRPSDEAAARTLAAVIPGARIVPDSTATSGLILTLGSSFTAVTDTTGSAPPQTGAARRSMSASSPPTAGGTSGTAGAGSATTAPAATQPPVAASNTQCTP